MKRNMTLVLAMLLLLSSCNTNIAEEQQSESDVQSTIEEGQETILKDSLPERDYNGAAYVILSASEQWQETYAAEENTGNALNDAVFARNATVAERFDVDLQYEIVNAYMARMETVTSKLRGSVQAGDAAYDLMTASSAYTASYIVDGLLQNMAKMEYLDLDAPWYFSETNQNLYVRDKLYIVAGAFGLNTLNQLGAVIFNKEMMDDLGEKYPYQTVLDGDWTYDAMLTLGTKASLDLNGDGTFDKEDRYGILSTRGEAIQWLGFGMGYRIIQPDEEGLPSFVGATESTIDTMDTLAALMQNTSVYYACREIDPVNEMIPMFIENKGLFAVYELKLLTYEEMREGPDFGVVPMPKKNAEQEKYYSKCFAEVVAFPMVIKDADMSQVILEALNSTTYADLLPTYYDVMLQRKLVRDDDSAAMIDLIREGTICDFGMAYYSALDASLFAFEDIISTQSFSTWWAAHEQSLQTKLDTLLDELTNLEAGE